MSLVKNIKLEDEEENINLLKEFYLNKENRNLLNELLKYINRSRRYTLMNAFQKREDYFKSLCNNCFKQFKEGEGALWTGDHEFCASCSLTHFDKYTEFIGSYQSSDCVSFAFHHTCDILHKEYFKKSINALNFVKFITTFTNNTRLSTNPSRLFWPDYFCD